MSRTLYTRVRAVFHEVCELEPPERIEVLDRMCAGDPELRTEVERLISAHDSSDGGLETTPPSAIASAFVPDIDGYRVLDVLGEGGMGVVYRAQQSRPNRMVALKAIRPGLITPSVTKRFKREAEVLGRLNHPGIAQVYAIGVGEFFGREAPYITMELVEGVPVTSYIASHDLGTRARLELACSICEAIEHAHQRGVIHRDLKPANILVDAQGRPKVLDFGIARLTEHEARVTTMQTEAGRILGTASYMSPEQALGDPTLIDERSDVYALGVLLFEILTGHMPHDVHALALPDAIRVIREDDATRIATLDTRLRGDIDTIVARALERDRERRYQSAAELAADLRRYLSDEPILARAPTALYQLRKYVRRNRTLVVGAASVVFVLLVGLAGVSVALSRESEARQSAEESLTRAEASVTFLQDVLLGLTPEEAAGRDTTLLRDMLSKAMEALEDEGMPAPVRGEMYAIVGDALHSVFEFDAAIEPLRSAVAIFESLGDAYRGDAELAELLLADSLVQISDIDAGEEILLRIVERDRADDAHAHVADALRQLAEIQMDRGDLELALAHIGEAELIVDPEDLGVRSGLMMLRGATLRRLQRIEEAKSAFLLALELSEQNDDRLQASKLLNSLAIVARMEGRTDDAEDFYRRSIDMWTSVDGRDNPDTAAVLSNLGRLLANQDRHEEAKEILTQSVDMHASVFGDDHFTLGFPLRSLGLVYSKLGDHPKAILTLDESLRRIRNRFGDEHPYVVTVLLERADAHRRAAEWDRAIADYQSGIDVATGLGLDPEDYLLPLNRGLSDTFAAAGDAERALATLRAMLDIAKTPESKAEIEQQLEALAIASRPQE